MAYIGRDTDKISNVEVLDNITFDGSSSYTLQKGGSNFTPSSANTLLVSINGVVQAGNFTVSGSTIDFGTAVAGTSTCDFILHYGIGLITTVSDGTITTAKVVDGAITSAKLASGVGGVAGITSSADATAITIDSSENVGIGTSSPTARFDTRISTSTGKVAEFHNSSGYGIDLTVESNSGVNTISSGTTQGLAFATNSSSNERMRINSSGQLIIGATSIPTSGSTVNGVQLKGGSDQNFLSVDSTGGQEQLRFINPNGRVGSIRTSGSSTTYNTSSDYRLKENVSYDFDATSRLKQLKPARFNFIADANTTVDGFLAHEVSSIVPEAISGEKDAVDENGNPEYQGIDQSKLVPLLVKTIQELEARITALENA